MKKNLAGRSLKPPAPRLRVTAAALLALLLTATTLTTPASAAGGLDPTFGAGGLVTTDFGGAETASAVAVQADGRLVVVGIAGQGGGASLFGDICVVRYGADGALDTTFGGGGKVLLDFGGTADGPAGVAVRADGKIVVVGSAYKYNEDFTGAVSDFVLARLNPDGTPDATYGAGGKVKLNFDTPFPAYPVSAVMQPDGRVVVAGYVRRGNDPQVFASDFFAARFNPDGTPDATFGTQGHTSVDIAEYDIAFGAALQPDGKIVLAGVGGANVNTFGSATSFALARLKPDGTPDTTFDGDGRLTTAFLGQDYAYGVAVQADGKIVAAGAAGGRFNLTEPDFALARYEANGALDPTFGAGGRATLDFDSGSDTAVGVAAAPGGRILAGGYTFPSRYGGPLFAAARFNPDGSPDNTFGAGGRATTGFPGGERATGRGMTAQPDGRLVVVGDVDFRARPQANNADIGVARFGPGGEAEPTSFARFSSQTYGGSEGCAAAVVTVSREGDLSAPAAVEFRTRDGSARQHSDYTHMHGTLDFAAGESSRTFAVPVNDDAFAEGAETIRVELVGGSPNVNFRAPADATVDVSDDDAADGGANPLDDPRAFVCQHYHDFLSRQPDADGLRFWTEGIESCGADKQCREVRRIDVSTAFFLSIEFQQTGYFVIRAHKAAFGNKAQTPRYFDFLRDTQQVARGVVVGRPDADARLEANKRAFAAALVARAEFAAARREQSAGEYADALFRNAGVVPTQDEFLSAVAAYGAGGDAGRAAALRSVSESDSVYRALYNAGFVLSLYFGDLRRDPDDPPDFNFGGYDFWLAKLDGFSLAGEDVRDERVALARVRRAEMVKAFVTSAEYRQRFGRP
ncbi:MAG TPA: Calx-beta domain-containing protein [Pyrinomonadaceae bacterium]